MTKKQKGKDGKPHHVPQSEVLIDERWIREQMILLESELNQKMREIYSRPPPVTDEEVQADAQERRKVVRDIVVKERRIRGVALKLEAEKKIREAMNRLIPHAPKWKDEKAVAEFVKLRPLRLAPVIDLESPPYPQRTGIHGRPEGERAFLSVMPHAERAFVEIEWYSTQVYLWQAKKGAIRKMKNAIRERSFELAAAELRTTPEKLKDYRKRSIGERGGFRRFWPRPPKIKIKI